MMSGSSTTSDCGVNVIGADNQDEVSLPLRRRVRLRFQAAKLPRVKRRTTPPSTLVLVTSRPSNALEAAMTGLGGGDDDDGGGGVGSDADNADNNTDKDDSSNNNNASNDHYHHHHPPKPTPMSPNDERDSALYTSLDMPSSVWGRTELVEKSRNPQWTQAIEINYTMGTELFFYAKIMHWDSASRQFVNCFGSALFEVNNLLTSADKTKVKRLRQGGLVFCQAEIVPDHTRSLDKQQQLRFQILATTPLQLPRSSSTSLVFRSTTKKLLLPKIGGGAGGGQSSHGRREGFHSILELTRQPWGVAQPTWVTVWRSLPVLDSTQPIWEMGEIDLDTLCQGDLDRPIRLAALLSPSRLVIGFSETTVRNLLTASASSLLPNTTNDNHNTDPRHGTLGLQRGDKDLTEVGRLKVCRAEIFYQETQHEIMAKNWEALRSRAGSSTSEAGGELTEGPPTDMVDLSRLYPVMVPNASAVAAEFQSYVHEKGCDINLAVAIDFTSSNGDPRNENSNHFQSPDSLNDYEETIQMIGTAISAYSRTPQHAVWGFGAKFDGVCRHLFQCGPSRYVTSVEEIHTAYRSMFQTDLIMSGPTIVGQVLQAAAACAKKYHDAMVPGALKYLVLLIIIDGVMDDWEETQRKLVVYSPLPLSIVFVGIGRASFDGMTQLGCYSAQQQQQQQRPNTCFVEFRTHQHNPSALSQSALQHIPAQLCAYMRLRGF